MTAPTGSVRCAKTCVAITAFSFFITVALCASVRTSHYRVNPAPMPPGLDQVPPPSVALAASPPLAEVASSLVHSTESYTSAP